MLRKAEAGGRGAWGAGASVDTTGAADMPPGGGTDANTSLDDDVQDVRDDDGQDHASGAPLPGTGTDPYEATGDSACQAVVPRSSSGGAAPTRILLGLLGALLARRRRER